MSPVKMINYQCKYCGRRVCKSSKYVPLKTQCPKRPKGQPHVWARVS